MKSIIYARFSPRPNAAECDSIEKQIARCQAYCTSQEYEVLGVYQDANMSGGRADNRPGLQEAITLACQHKAVLVCYDLSRLARSTKDAIAIADQLREHDANLAFLDMKIDTSSPTGRCFFTILAAFAQMYREEISYKTQTAMLAHQKNGRLMSRHAPYGMKVNPVQTPDGVVKLLEECPEEQQMIKRIAGMACDGMTPREITDQLNDEFLTCRGGVWHQPTVANILKRANVPYVVTH
jgi:site-specific DNA recombinase